MEISVARLGGFSPNWEVLILMNCFVQEEIGGWVWGLFGSLNVY